ncbi:helix-turn-helix domain-containing protein [Marinivivus vitaminiproducens]|uniref:AraC family transcriptional regulator n=1 Tax=Marinivivus vitaminiproducens TaxID=3035935 RepID=UPI0027A59595|nr:helix-turn-helix transcriptional regulator [Geminicoccaceae bacterium SCSIO 64248]
MRARAAEECQHIPRAVAVLAKDYGAETSTGQHSHKRAQLLYATSGLMVTTTVHGTWAVPSGHALLIAPRIVHDVRMHGTVAMRTAYLHPASLGLALPRSCRVLEVSPLLDAALQALAEEPVLYDEDGRGGHLAALILDEIARAEATRLALPMPADTRLRTLCRALLDTPALPYGIDDWADRIGLSRRSLTRHFRAETGLSFGEWRRRLRLLHTLTCRAQGQSLLQAARTSGYRSPQALKAMMRRTGDR